MLKKAKIKGPMGRIYPPALVIIYIFAVVEYFVLGPPFYSNFLAGVFFIVMGIVQMQRSHLLSVLILGILLGTGCWHILVITEGLIIEEGFFSFFSVITYIIHVFVLVLFLILAWPVLYGHEKLEANTRRLFKLASIWITESSDGFTDRPFSAGKPDASNKEIMGLIRFLSGRSIGRAYHQGESIFLAFSLGRSPLKVNDPHEISYVMFDKQGSMSVHISEFDYRQYKKRLTFDQLCNSLGEVFKRFLEYYKAGNDARIISELKSV